MTSKIVAATGVAVIRRPGLPKLGNAIQRAMEKAIVDSAGKPDAEVRAAMLKARDQIKARWNELANMASVAETEAAKTD